MFYIQTGWLYWHVIFPVFLVVSCCFCLLFGWMMFLSKSLSSPRVPNLGFMYPWGYICLSQRGTFRGLTWSDGARYKKQVWRPHFQNRSFGSKCTVWKEVLVTLLGRFGAPAVICPPLLTRPSGNCALLVTLWVHLLHSRNKLTLRHKTEST